MAKADIMLWIPVELLWCSGHPSSRMLACLKRCKSPSKNHALGVIIYFAQYQQSACNFTSWWFRAVACMKYFSVRFLLVVATCWKWGNPPNLPSPKLAWSLLQDCKRALVFYLHGMAHLRGMLVQCASSGNCTWLCSLYRNWWMSYVRPAGLLWGICFA